MKSLWNLSQSLVVFILDYNKQQRPSLSAPSTQKTQLEPSAQILCCNHCIFETLSAVIYML